MLKLRYEKMEDVPQDARQFYAEDNGNFVLSVDGVVDRAAMESTNKQNQSLLTQLDEIKKRFEGIDPDAAREQEAAKQKLAEEQALKAGEVERVIESRLKTVQDGHSKKLNAVLADRNDLAAERDALVARLSDIQIDQGVVMLASHRGLRPTAIPDITTRARQSFKLIKGVPTAFQADGQSVRMSRDGVNPLTLEEWIEDLVSEAPHLFAESEGQYVLRPGPKKATNPFSKQHRNLTEQMRLQKTNRKR